MRFYKSENISIGNEHVLNFHSSSYNPRHCGFAAKKQIPISNIPKILRATWRSKIVI